MTHLETRHCANPACRNRMRRPPWRFRQVQDPVCSEHCRRVLLSNRMKLQNPSRKGAPILKDGYLVEFNPTHRLAMADGYVRVHRRIAEEAPRIAGRQGGPRPLAPDETVGFLDGDRTNLDPRNLYVKRRRSRVA